MTTFADYSHLITTRPHSLRRVFISDLHLSKEEPALVQAFLALLSDLKALPNLEELYILGDWFDYWIGDDAYLILSTEVKKKHWLTPLIEQLTVISSNGCKIKIMHGNRDFLIGQRFCDLFAGQLIAEPYYIAIGTQQFRLEHGDALCTDDKAYQRFRRIMRHPLVQWGLLNRPLVKRQALAQKIRQKSSQGKRIKSAKIMDVNTQAVRKALQQSECLLHGHTHRPAIHRLASNTLSHKTHGRQSHSHQLPSHKTRYVLGDWRVTKPNSRHQKVEAVIAVALLQETEEIFQLINY